MRTATCLCRESTDAAAAHLTCVGGVAPVRHVGGTAEHWWLAEGNRTMRSAILLWQLAIILLLGAVLAVGCQEGEGRGGGAATECAFDAACDDGNPCTDDFCDGGRCVNVGLQGCDGADEDATDDGTIDRCPTGLPDWPFAQVTVEGDSPEFPSRFLWGAATSAHQAEGGNVNSDWWAWERMEG
ncbi:MAG: hypothetical protein ACYSVY_28930, partial [Planctomycetota bacterium]